ncbi:MAG: ATP-binding protein [Bacteroidales bacterium]|nr:ATP-binding protein [Bacteroidales bacterium]
MDLYQKGKFYTLPLKGIRNEGSNSFFIVDADGKEYAIRMFDFQKKDPSVQVLKELPCMCKDVHGDSIVFVQNFAQMFSERYEAGKEYPFIVNKEAYNPENEFRYYDIRDEYGVPFRLKCSSDTYLLPSQRIRCLIYKPNKNKMILSLVKARKGVAAGCISPAELLKKVGVADSLQCYVLRMLETADDYKQVRYYYKQGNPEWAIKAVRSVADVSKWTTVSDRNKERLLEVFYKVCLYLLEDSGYLLQFSEYERESFQIWIDEILSKVEINMQALRLINSDMCSLEIDTVLQKIRNSGYIYQPHHRMKLLIALFSMVPNLLEEKIDSILDLVAGCAKNWKLASFYDAFSSFLRFFIMENRDRANRMAVVDSPESRVLLNRMVRSICFMLLMKGGEGVDSQLYKSMLYHYLSFVRSRTVMGAHKQELSEQLVELAFSNLLLSEDNELDFTWGIDFSNAEIFAYKMLKATQNNTTYLTRTYEAHNVRFTASANGLTLSRTTSSPKDRNVLPQGFPGWQNLQVFLDAPSKVTVRNTTKQLTIWKSYWNSVEQQLFENRPAKEKPKLRKVAPDVGTITHVRITAKDDDHQYRFHCRIEDPHYEGEGYIDTYQKGGSQGIFHYDPFLDLDSFYVDGKPMILKVRVVAVGSPKDDKPAYTFDCVSMVDEMVREQVDYGEESACTFFYYDKNSQVLCGVTEYGYGIFVPLKGTNLQYSVGDSVMVRVTDAKRPNAIQGEIIGDIDDKVDVREAATGLLRDYCNDEFYEESDEELAEEAMGVSEDVFELEYVKEIINIIDHKAVLETNNSKAYAFLSLAHILSRMIDDKAMMHYIDQRRKFLCILEDYGTNGRVDDEALEALGEKNSDMVEKYPLIQQRLTEMRIVNCFGQPRKNDYLYGIIQNYESDNILSKLSRLMLSYNLMDGFGLQEHQQPIISKIKSILNVNVELPKIYSFGEENQTTEFKTSIVYPPDNNMKPDLKQQTFNIMKVMCGMLNSYGGTLYLGVSDTGTACGLTDDVTFLGGNFDKYDLYVRNSIRNAFGDHVNASISVEHPEAGKHYIYAIRIPASKTPVALRTDGVCYLREGTSTYPVEYSQLLSIMDERNFAMHNAQPLPDTQPEASATTATAAASEEASASAPVQKAKAKPVSDAAANIQQEPPETSDEITTSRLRTNVVESWADNYGIDTVCYFKLKAIGDWCVMEDEDWSDSLLTLAIQEEERDGFLIIAYDNGRINRVPISQIIDKTPGKIYKMFADRRPLFVSPAAKDTALLTAYLDDKGHRYFRLDDLQYIPEGKMMQDGGTLTDLEFTRMYACEIVPKSAHDSLKRLHNQKPTTLGMPVLTDYGSPEQEALRNLGIEL